MVKNYQIIRRKKLIEVSIPLDDINKASVREKSIRHGHPSTLHLWWSRKPLATSRAILLCQVIDDPSSLPEEFKDKNSQDKERQRLLNLISSLCKWENINNSELINEAKLEIQKTWERFCEDNNKYSNASEKWEKENLPGFFDPFAGGGSIPLEAARLGFKSAASDVNTVAVLINKSMIELPARFKDIQPISNIYKKESLYLHSLKNFDGLVEDLNFYSLWLLEKVKKDISIFYPDKKITSKLIQGRDDLKPYEGQSLKIIAWIWSNTVESPNPNFKGCQTPLLPKYYLCNKKNNFVYVEPEAESKSIKFKIKIGNPLDRERVNNGAKSGRGANFRCLYSGDVISSEYIQSYSQKNGLQNQIVAIVLQGKGERLYIEPTEEDENIAKSPKNFWEPSLQINGEGSYVGIKNYGMNYFKDIFTPRQLFCLSTFTSFFPELFEKLQQDFIASLDLSNKKFKDFGNTSDLSKQYASLISTYLCFALNKVADRGSKLSRWDPTPTQSGIINTFCRQAFSMTWDFAESNPLGTASGSFVGSVNLVAKAIKNLPSTSDCKAVLVDAQTQNFFRNRIISTDPPYYDNIPYSDLSDYFYLWQRQCLSNLFPSLYKTIGTSKLNEISSFQKGNDLTINADEKFINDMKKALNQISISAHEGYPVSIYYAYKQNEINKEGQTKSTGWETFLEALLSSGFIILSTWPIRTELTNRLRSLKSNALSSSILLVCEKKKENLNILSRNKFKLKLREELPKLIKEFEKTNIAPVDIAQAAIGPGMSIYSKAKTILNPDDSKMSVGEALIEINSALDEYLSKDDLELDIDTRFALTFFESFGYSERPFGDAEGLAKARNVSVEGIVRAGILKSVAGKVNLIKRENLSQDWDPLKDDRLCVWEATQYLIRTLEIEGEVGASKLFSKLKNIYGKSNLTSNCRSLAYRLYNHCEKNKKAEEARSYNSLIISWPELEKLSLKESSLVKNQKELF